MILNIFDNLTFMIELGVEYNEDDQTTCENINNLIEAISKINDYTGLL